MSITKPQGRSIRARRTLVALAAVAIALTACSSHASSAGTTTGGTSAPPLPFLHVVVPTANGTGATAPTAGPGGTLTPYLADSSGRQILMHGVDVVGIQDNFYAGGDGQPALYPYEAAAYDGSCPKDSSLEAEFPVCEIDASNGEWVSTAPGSNNDLAQIRQQGFDVIRLAVSWSLLEPTPGNYSQTYIGRIAQFVGWAQQQGIYVILDMHQDQYSRYVLPTKGEKLPAGCTVSTGNDGAPAWAVFTDGKPACALLGQSAINPGAAAAMEAFYQNHTVPGPLGESPGPGLEDHYIGALASLAKEFSNNSTVVGYEIMNEPPVGSTGALPLANLYQTSSQDLYPFYKRAIEALTGVRDSLPTCPKSQPTSLTGACAYPQLTHVNQQSMFYEPLGFRNLFDFSPQVSTPFSSYPNLVYSPHIYTHVFTADASFFNISPQNSPYPPSYDFGYATALSEARAMNSATFVTEFGNAPSGDQTLLAGMTKAQQLALVGGSLWAWTGNTTDKTLGSCWAVYCRYVGPSQTPAHVPTATEQLQPTRVTYLVRVIPRSTAGTLLSYSDDPTSGAFTMIATAATPVTKGQRSHETVVYIPQRVAGSVTVSGGAVIDTVVTQPDGSRLAYIAPTGTGRYSVSVGTPGTTVVLAATQQALNPLQPISEVQARAQLEGALQQLAAAPATGAVGNAALATTLLGSLFGTGPDPNTLTP